MTLSLITTTDLVDELKRRYPVLLVAGSADLNKDCSAEILFYHGPILSLIGVVDIAHMDLMNQYHGDMDEAEDIP